MNKTGIIIVSIIFALFVIILATTFKIGEVPDVSWRVDYNPNSKEPYGLWIMKTLLEEKYGEDKVSINYNYRYYNDESDSTILYIAVNSTLQFDYYEASELEYMASLGNDVLLIANNLSFEGDYINAGTEAFPSFEDSLTIGYPDDQYAPNTYLHYRSDFNISVPYLLRTFNINVTADSSIVKETILWSDISDAISFEMTIDSGRIITHSVPEMFSNIASLQDFYADHFNHIFNNPRIQKVVFTLPGGMNKASQSPLSVLLANRGLAYGYYMLLITLFTLLYFGSKRRLTPIKVIPPLKNNSLKYVEIMSRLYEVHGDNVAIAKIIESNFYDRVHYQYGLLKNDVDFDIKLGKRIKVDPKKINGLREQFNAYKEKMTDIELVKLRNTISSIFKMEENG